MKNFTVTMIVIFLFMGGCAQKVGLLTPDVVAKKALAFTKKAEIYNSLEIKASMVVSYLNPILKEYKEKDKTKVYFLISLFIDNDYADREKQGLFNPDYTLFLNGQTPMEVSKLKENNDLIKIAPIQNMWSSYYLVSFEKPQTKDMKMELKSQRFGTSGLTFVTDPKE